MQAFLSELLSASLNTHERDLVALLPPFAPPPLLAFSPFAPSLFSSRIDGILILAAASHVTAK